MKSLNNKPWLDNSGNPLPISQLREISKQWSAKQWEDYAASIEVSSDELVMTKKMLAIERRSNNTDFFKTFSPDTADILVQKYIAAALTNLTSKQSEIIQLKIFQGLSFKESSVIMGISKTTAHQHYLNALKKLKSFAIVRPSNLSNMRDKSNSEETHFTPDEDIREVMEMEISRIYRSPTKYIPEE